MKDCERCKDSDSVFIYLPLAMGLHKGLPGSLIHLFSIKRFLQQQQKQLISIRSTHMLSIINIYGKAYVLIQSYMKAHLILHLSRFFIQLSSWG